MTPAALRGGEVHDIPYKDPLHRLPDSSNPLTEVYLLFLQATFPVFSTLNLLLQREKASIFQLYEEMTKFIKKLCSRFMTPAALRGGEVHDIPYKDPLHRLPGEKLNVGFTTRATLNRLLEAGEVTSQKAQQFQQAALAFLVGAVEYAMDKLPFQELLPFQDPKEQDQVSEEFMEYQLMDIALPQDPTVFDVEEFWGRMSTIKNKELLPFQDPKEQDQVSEEFMEYQLMDIALPQDPTVFDVEEFWGRMSTIKNKEHEFKKKAEMFHCQFRNLKDVCKYFRNHWEPIGHLWSNFRRCYKHGDLDTNNLIERYMALSCMFSSLFFGGLAES
ncbi:histone H1-like protein [Labeo rohita]|uniref:Histone H1-like protein n=1 Tax=Labeo rohita TaxID=84645 RepID=A0A498NXK2_LABRO|nr:histone H1-like protein [Labeo rohita]